MRKVKHFSECECNSFGFPIGHYFINENDGRIFYGMNDEEFAEFLGVHREKPGSELVRVLRSSSRGQ